MKIQILALLITAAGSLAVPWVEGAQNWPQYRGPQAGGVDASAPLPTNWNVGTGENVRWQTPIPGLAHAAPIVWGERVYVATAVQAGKSELKVGLYGDIASVKEKETNQWRLLALDRTTGRVVWNTLAHEAVPKVARHTKGTHCNSTPATDGRRIVAIFGSEGGIRGQAVARCEGHPRRRIVSWPVMATCAGP
jgi:outer membrane protein assembly factor BamB